jgi:hypothetical protein
LFLLNKAIEHKCQTLIKNNKVRKDGHHGYITVVIHGNVTDVQDGNNIPSTNIRLRNENDSMYYVRFADSLGNFKFNHIPSGLYKIEVMAIGYHSKDTSVTLGTGGIWEWKFGLARWDKNALKGLVF